MYLENILIVQRLLTDIDVLNAFEMSMTECEKAIEYFKNKSKNEKVAASTADVEKILNLPASPRLILLG
ncbi:hypothetical protein cypCar_00045461 [Cyprinus carpio]|nr:hypothetical protein cypCar_00045461 [Cyprinus carpio]